MAEELNDEVWGFGFQLWGCMLPAALSPVSWWLLPLPAPGDLYHPVRVPEELVGKWTHQMEKLFNEVNSYRIRTVVLQGDGRTGRAVLEVET